MTVTSSPTETMQFAANLASELKGQDILLLEGDLGAGKTCFVRGLCEGLGGDPSQVNSPTFVIMQEYPIKKNMRLVHIDAYRLSGPEELETIGWDELLNDKDAIIAIEWASRIAAAIPEKTTTVFLDHLSLNSREISSK